MTITKLFSALCLVSLAHGLEETNNAGLSLVNTQSRDQNTGFSLEETTKPCNDMALESIPAKYATTMMMNIQFGNSVGRTQDSFEHQ